MSKPLSHAQKMLLRLHTPRVRKKQLQLRLVNKRNVHEPPNPSPNTLPPEARALWDDVEAQAWEVYGRFAEEHKIPEKTAWKAVRMHYFRNDRGQWVPKPFVDSRAEQWLLDPGDTIRLGKLLDYGWITQDGDVVRREFSEPPDLWWNHDTKTLYAFPGFEIPQACLLVDDDLDHLKELFHMWAQREAKCANELSAEVPWMYPRGATDSESYRSDKWHDRNDDPEMRGSDEYIHLNGDRVWVWEDVPDEDDDPSVVMIRGGNLDVEARGIIH